MKKIITLLLSAVLFLFPAMSVQAAAPTGDNTGWLRAKLTYEFDDGVTGLDDSIITFADGWSKTDGWFYYKDPVKPGEKVRFITAVSVPASWTEDLENKAFKVVVTVEASEMPPGSWNGNTEVLYSKTFDMWSIGYETSSDLEVRRGSLTVDIHEYQLEDGKEVTYVNDKIIVPGQTISKIVEFELGGSLGKNVLRELIKTGQEHFLVMGLAGLTLFVGCGFLLYKRRTRG